MKRILIPAIAAVLVLSACDTDRGARKDLPNEQQNLDDSSVQVFLMPDQFPNVAHKCDGTTGMWTTTDRNVWIVYRDPKCDGTGEIVVLDNIPGASQVTP